MKPVLPVISALLLLAACENPLSIYYRPGISVSRMQNDTTDCQVAALKDAPIANQVRQRPPIYFPGRQYCNAGGCWYSPGYWVDGGVYTVDLNRDLRGRVEVQCMAKKGYQPLTLPNCTASVKAAAPPRATTTLPQITESSCVIRYDDGYWQIVNPVTKSGS